MPTHTDPVDLVRELWPNDDFTAKLGPDDLHTAALAIGEIAASLASSTVVASSREKALPDVADGYPVIGALSEAMSNQQELLANLAAWADDLAAEPTLRHSAHRDADTETNRAQASITAHELSESLREATQHATALSDLLRTAHTKISPLYQDED